MLCGQGKGATDSGGAPLPPFAFVEAEVTAGDTKAAGGWRRTSDQSNAAWFSSHLLSLYDYYGARAEFLTDDHTLSQQGRLLLMRSVTDDLW